MKQFGYSLQCEWLKTRHSAASWLVLVGAFFIPFIMLFISLVNYKKLPAQYAHAKFWEHHFFQSWQIMAFLLLPLGVILASSLITQIEYRNNTWKQLHATPQEFATIFFAKLTVIIGMMLQFFILFNIGIYLSAIVPALIFPAVHYPPGSFPIQHFLKVNALFFVDCLPIIALQYLLSLHCRNFIVPLGFGIALLVASTFAIQWQYGYLVPYTYSALNYFKLRVSDTKFIAPVSIHIMASLYTMAFLAGSYILYIRKSDKC